MILKYGVVRLPAPTSISIVGCRIARGALDGIISSISHAFHVGRKDSFFSSTTMFAMQHEHEERSVHYYGLFLIPILEASEIDTYSLTPD
jgi:hypothetical protein